MMADLPSKPLARVARRSESQLLRQEKVFMRRVVGNIGIRAIAAELGISKDTVLSDLRHEFERRAGEIEERREFELARSIAIFEHVIAQQMRKSEMYDAAFLAASEQGKSLRIVSDNSLAIVVDARTRIDKLLGLDAPTKIDLGMNVLLAALAPKDPI